MVKLWGLYYEISKSKELLLKGCKYLGHLAIESLDYMGQGMALCADAKAGREVGTIKDYSLTSTDADSADLKLLETANLDDIQAAWATAPTYKDIVD